MAPAKLLRHLETKHQQNKSKSIDFFKRKESELKAQKTLIRNTGTENELVLKICIPDDTILSILLYLPLEKGRL